MRRAIVTIFVACLCPSVMAKSSVNKQTIVEPSIAHQLNTFSVRAFAAAERKTLLREGTVLVKLLSPINSEFNRAGDDVEVEVVSSETTNGRPWVPAGSVLKGCVERVDKSTFVRTDGSVRIRLYEGYASDYGAFELNIAPGLHDLPQSNLKGPKTKKEITATILKSAAFLAVPLALGTGGTSIAITTGAGAVIGGLFAEPGHRIKGIAGGAWDGSGLCLLNPIVQKGDAYKLAVGTTLLLRMDGPTELPQQLVDSSRGKKNDAAAKLIKLETNATLLTKKSVAVPAVEARVCELMKQKNLASALSELEEALKIEPDNAELKRDRETLIHEMISSPIYSTTEISRDM